MKRLVIGLLLVALAGLIGWSIGSWAAPDADTPPATADIPAETTLTPAGPNLQVRELERLSRKYGCNPDGLAAGVLPQHSVVRLPKVKGPKAIQLVSFDEGWEMHLGERPGTLLAVCAR
jgi:hypothetical protein